MSDRLSELRGQRDALLSALCALGSMPGGYCFCPENRDPDKQEHTGECNEAREAILLCGAEAYDAMARKGD